LRSNTIQSFQTTLESLDLSPIVEACFDTNRPDHCYQKTVTAQIERQRKPEWAAFDSSTQALLREFFSKQSFSAANRQTEKRYETMYASHAAITSAFAQEAWKKCSGVPLAPSSTLPQEESQTQYTHPAIEACLERTIRPGILNRIMDSIDSRYRLTNNDTRKYVESMFTKRTLSAVHALQETERANEQARALVWQKNAHQTLASSLMNDHSWIREETDVEINYLVSCEGAALRRLRDDEPKGIRLFIEQLKFIPQDSFSRLLASSACAIVSSDEKFHLIFNGTKHQIMAEAIRKLNLIVAKHTGETRKRCAARRSGEAGVIESFIRRFELTDPVTLCTLKDSHKIMATAWEEFQAQPLWARLASERDRLWEYLLRNTSSLIKTTGESITSGR
jgi:hypothetical protein